jgi:hypothetical protein
MRRLALMLATILLRTLLVASAVAARRKRATRGDANAVLNAFGNGGWAVINHSDVARRGRVDQQMQIRPFDFFDGRHYCALYWHTIVFADIEGGDRPFRPGRERPGEALGAQVVWDCVEADRRLGRFVAGVERAAILFAPSPRASVSPGRRASICDAC